ncbi:MAG: ribosome silencing factor [Ruminiclostridium sp.]|nr:ribosome silencing factor [Ruminiclostridium sp.]
MTDIEEVKLAVKALDSKKAGNIKVIRIEDITTLANYFVIAEGTSSTQVKALADEVEFRLEQADVRPKCSINQQGTNWITLDYIDVVVHVFLNETREFYGLEKLWADGEEMDISSLM